MKLQAVFFDLVLEGAAADAEEFGGLGPVLIRSVQGIEDHLLLRHPGDVLHFYLEGRILRSGLCPPELRRQLVIANRFLFGHEHHSLQDILQFPDVSGPVVAAEGCHDVG